MVPPEEEQNNNPLFFIEKSNRIVAVIFLIFLILVFMDYQASRHYDTMQSNAQNNNFDQELEQAQEKLDTELKKNKAQVSDSISSASADTILGKLSSIKKEIKASAKDKLLDEISAIKATPSKASSILGELKPIKAKLRSTPAITKQITDEIMHPHPYYYLYFIRFSNKKSKLIRVKRAHSSASLSLSTVMENLHKGPSVYEKGLLNNFNRRIKINKIKLVANTVILDLSPAIGAMGPHVIHDRLEQITHTLTQFPQIDYVNIKVNGKTLPYIGEAKVVLSDKLRPNRPSFLAKEN